MSYRHLFILLEGPWNDIYKGANFAQLWYRMKKIFLWMESPILDFSKDKLVFAPIYFLILFKDLFGLK